MPSRGSANEANPRRVEQVVQDAGNDRVETIVPAGKGGGKASRGPPPWSVARRHPGIVGSELRSRAVESAGLARLCSKGESAADPVMGSRAGRRHR